MQDDVVKKARWLGQRIGIIGKCFLLIKPNHEYSVRESDSEEDESEFDEEEDIMVDDDFLIEEGKLIEQQVFLQLELQLISVQEKQTLSSSSSNNKEEFKTRHNGHVRRHL
jgi:hypothetical protein